MRRDSTRARGARLRRLAPRVLCLAVLLAPVLAAAHPTAEDLRERALRARLGNAETRGVGIHPAAFLRSPA